MNQLFSVRIAVIGAGYVGLNTALMLSRHNEVVCIDIDSDKVKSINSSYSEITATTIRNYWNFDIVVVCVPTDFFLTELDTSIVNNVINDILKQNNHCLIVIKSTLPIGYCDKYNNPRILYNPEFLRETSALEDCLNPDRIIIGCLGNSSTYLNALLPCLDNNPETVIMSYKEAEMTKLASNAFLANRIAFFNEIDEYCEHNGLNSKQVIKGMCLDKRIGDYYNNPSFGYGGYCLPKDTRQLAKHYADSGLYKFGSIIKQSLYSNIERKMYISNQIQKQVQHITYPTIGIYKLSYKENSSNYRQSAIIDIINDLKQKNYKILIYDNSLNENTFCECEVTNDLDYFKQLSHIIVANRIDDNLSDVMNLVYTRDVNSIQ